MGRYTELQKAWSENIKDFHRISDELDKINEAFQAIKKEREEMEREPIKDSDIIVMISSQFAPDYSVYKITDQSREWVKEQMENIAQMEEDERVNLDTEEYFRNQGAEIIPILDSAGKGDGYPTFYDYRLDIDGTEIVEITEYSVKEQVENLIHRFDFGEPVFNDSEWSLLYNYAEATGSMEHTYRLARELRDTLHEPDSRLHEQVIENARKEMESADMEAVFQNEEEKELLTGEADRFGIYQLKEGEELHYHRFVNLDMLEKSGLQVEKGNYKLIYTAPLTENLTLDEIFERFNLFRPEDFTGHSLSVSDIVLLHKNGENHAQYVDRFGFREVPQFLELLPERAAEEEHLFEQPEMPIAYQIGEGYFSIQPTDGGFDYTFYHGDFTVMDGGIYENSQMPMQAAAEELLQEKGLHLEDGVVVDYDMFMEQVEKAETMVPEKTEPSYLPVYRYLAADAWEHGELKEFRASMNENIACKTAIETAIRENFDGMRLNHDAAVKVVEKYGPERVSYVLANTIRELESDGHISRDNKAWAQTIPIYTEREETAECVVISHPAVLDGFIGLAREKMLEQERKAFPMISDRTQPEASLHHMSCANIEETVLSYAQSVAEEAGIEVQIRAARVYGSRTAGIEKADSDVDVVLEFQGDISEDGFFNLLHEEELTIGGMLVDMNPITPAKSGTIEEFLARANEYLEEKVKSMRETASDRKKVDVVQESPAQTLSFYVAECMEFPRLGEYHDGLNFEEAVALYESIPEDRMSAIKGIGFVLHREDEPEEDLSSELVSGGMMDVDMINHVPEFRESPLVQWAIREAISTFPEIEVWDRETRVRERKAVAEDYTKDCEVLAAELDDFAEEVDLYEYRDSVEDKAENIRKISADLRLGNTESIREWLQEVMEEEEPVEDVKAAQDFLRRMDDLAERRERNPLAKVEELEEANYNQIDGVLNNQKTEKGTETKGMSIMERLAVNKEKIERQSQGVKEMEKGQERGRE
ncbi:MAG: DUF3849 domain-containing protein [Blautia sp.]